MRAIAFSPAGELYGATRGGRLYRLDLATGDTVGIGTARGISYAGLTFSPNGILWASVMPTVGAKDDIYTVDISTGDTTLVGKTGDGAGTPAIAFGPDGTLYGLKGIGAQTNTVITIDTSTGTGTQLFSTGMQGLDAIAMRVLLGPDAVAPSAALPGAFTLAQNYPNPFNPNDDQVRVTRALICDADCLQHARAAGHVLVHERRNAGVHTATFHAAGLSSGSYICTCR